MDRRVLGEILYGSQNYKLEGPDSDEDYRKIIMPSFCDLYYRKEATNETGWDVRKFTGLVLEGNFNAIELLFSVKKEFYSPEFEYLWYTLRAYSSDIVARRSLKFYYSVRGCFMNSLDRAVTAENEDNYLKHIARAQYFVDMLDNLRLSHFYMRDGAEFSQKTRETFALITLPWIKESFFPIWIDFLSILIGKNRSLKYILMKLCLIFKN